MAGDDRPRRPTRAELEAARGRLVPDVVADDLRLLLCGINPGLWSAWSGHHFARPGNRFWTALHRAGLTPRVLHPSEEGELLRHGVGVTNVVPRATAAAAELSAGEIRAGGARLEELVRRRRPRAVAVLGVGAYRTAFGRPRAGLGRQPEPLAGVPVWVVPNPSGLQARYGIEAIAALLRAAAAEGGGPAHPGQDAGHRRSLP
ncbi:G/U mismatch-specific DNA glycosylase [Miltoncostaea marina]|uniref:G/U mismatch-specific DNA glycosylase n=1 Tax=Miltoncostaea marina TaxID=2843215 RepID=UPI001C3DC4EC|nr:G/U mismatch-specific DNA glycosylase [Miltoncostaea marina]